MKLSDALIRSKIYLPRDAFGLHFIYDEKKPTKVVGGCVIVAAYAGLLETDYPTDKREYVQNLFNKVKKEWPNLLNMVTNDCICPYDMVPRKMTVEAFLLHQNDCHHWSRDMHIAYIKELEENRIL